MEHQKEPGELKNILPQSSSNQIYPKPAVWLKPEDQREDGKTRASRRGGAGPAASESVLEMMGNHWMGLVHRQVPIYVLVPPAWLSV